MPKILNIEFIECPICGCKGIHACIGYKPVPLTPEELKEFDKTLQEIVKQIKKDEEGYYDSSRNDRMA